MVLVMLGLSVSFRSCVVGSWTTLFGSPGAETYANAIAVGASDTPVVVGQTAGNLDDQLKMGISDAFITKFSVLGTKYWTRQLGVANANTTATRTFVDANDNYYMTGATTGALDGQTINNSMNAFVTKYNTNGEKQWTRIFSPVGGGAIFGPLGGAISTGVAVDTSGNIYITGVSGGSIDGQVLSGTMDAFIVKYNSVGEKQWTRLLGLINCETVGSGIAVDGNGDIYITGRSSAIFDTNFHNPWFTFFLAKYNSEGQKQWVKQQTSVGGYFDMGGSDIAIDASNNIYVAGSGDVLILTSSPSSRWSAFVSKYYPNGSLLWTSTLYNATAAPWGNKIAVDASGNSYVTSHTPDNLDGQMKTGIEDVFVTKIDSAGVRQGTKFNGSGKCFLARYRYCNR